MARLTAAQRKAAPHAGPGDSFPIPDANHARLALAMAGHAANPSAVRAAVHKRYPNIGSKGSKRKHGLAHMAHVTHSRSGR